MIRSRTIRQIAALALMGSVLSSCATMNDRVVEPIGAGWTKVTDGEAAEAEGPSSKDASQKPFSSKASLARLRGKIVPPRWQEGDWWKYSDGYGLRVQSAEASVTKFTRTDAPAQWIMRRGFLREKSQSATQYREVIYRTAEPEALMSFQSGRPLAFQREYLADGELRTHATSWTVEGKKRITVPAGTFDTWVIVWRTRNITTNWSGFERWYYAPDVKHYVRLEYRYGSMPTMSRVLMDYWIMDWMEATSLDAAAVETASMDLGNN